MTTLPFRRFVRRDELRFNLDRLLHECLSAWSEGRPVPESCGDAIVDELDRCGLRSLPGDSDEASFDRVKTREDYRRCILAALDRWSRELSRPRTAEDIENYSRPCGE